MSKIKLYIFLIICILLVGAFGIYIQNGVQKIHCNKATNICTVTYSYNYEFVTQDYKYDMLKDVSCELRFGGSRKSRYYRLLFWETPINKYNYSITKNYPTIRYRESSECEQFRNKFIEYKKSSKNELDYSYSDLKGGIIALIALIITIYYLLTHGFKNRSEYDDSKYSYQMGKLNRFIKRLFRLAR